jgi:CRISPR-associated endoribonuclease Cas6
MPTVCPYGYIFETSPPPGSERLRHLSDIPRPFVIETEFVRPDEKGTEKKGEHSCHPGETFSFGLTLIGRAIDYLPYFLVTFRELGNIGIGRGRGRYRLSTVEAIPPEDQSSSEEGVDARHLVYSSEDELVRNVNATITFEDAVIRSHSLQADRDRRRRPDEKGTERVVIDFLTPTRLKDEGNLRQEPTFRTLIQRLLERLSSLAYFHCGEEFDLDFRDFLDRAGHVEIEKADLHWVDWERYSRRQETKMKLGGTVGRVIYRGDIGAFLPFLCLGEDTHVGKGTTFGLGQYRVVAVEDPVRRGRKSCDRD